MPRKCRIDAAGALHLVMVRDIERGAVFRNDADRNNFLERLKSRGLLMTVSLLNDNWRCAVAKDPGEIRDILIKTNRKADG